MKHLLLFIWFLGFHLIVRSQDLPGPPPNLQSLPSGSYVIPMDNTYQLNSGSKFNLMSYGLIVYLLNNNVKVKWAITTGKIKDGIDFNVVTKQVKPTLIMGASLRSFKAGPFVIYATDLAGVNALIDAFYTANGLIGADRPNVYQTTAAVTIDIRYDLSLFKRKAAILNDGGNQAIHVGFMTAAGIPAANYTVTNGSNLISSCYTFASEPHNSNTGPLVDSAISSVRRFVMNGGNFLAECMAISTYENNPLGRFQTTTGIVISNALISTSLNYPNPDLSFSQFEGVFNASLKGSLQNWTIPGSGINNEHSHATGIGANSSIIGASVSKLKGGLGGLAFYLGNHDFNTATIADINGIRMYMNAFLTPAVLVCSYVLPVRLMSFTGSINNNKAEIQWSVAENEAGEYFEIEKRSDDKNFRTIATITNSNKTDVEKYIFKEGDALIGTCFYRLKIVNKNGRSTYSNVIYLKNENSKTGNQLNILENPVSSTLTFNYNATNSGKIELNIYNNIGNKVYTNTLNTLKGNNICSLNIANVIAKGIYLFEVISKDNRNTVKLLKQ